MLKILLIAAAVTWKTPNEFRPNVDPVVTHVDLGGLVTEETDPTVPAWAKEPTPPRSTDEAEVRRIAFDVVGESQKNFTNTINNICVSSTNSPDGTFEDCRVQIGENAQAIGVTDGGRNQSIAIGLNSKASGMTSIAIGSGGRDEMEGEANGAKAAGGSSVAIGYDTYAGTQSVAIGPQAEAQKGTSVAIGLRANTAEGYSVAIGKDATTISGYSIAIGNGATANANPCVQIGAGENTRKNSLKVFNDYMATETFVSDALTGYVPIKSTSITIGSGATGASQAVTIGQNAKAEGSASVAIGLRASSKKGYSVALGKDAVNSNSYAIAIGNGATTDAQNAIQIGAGYNNRSKSLKVYDKYVATENFVDENYQQKGNYLTAETDPTVPAWAKNPTPPVTEETDPTVPAWAKEENPPAETDPTVPEWAKTNAPPIWTEVDPTVPEWAKNPNPPVTEESDPIFSEFASNTYVSVGGGSKANHVDSIAIGHTAEVSGVLGTNGQYTLSSPYGIAIGSGSTTIGTNSISLGSNASASESFGIAIGHGSKATKRYSIAIGEAAKSDIVLKGIAIGATSKTESQEAIAIGPGATVKKISTKSIAIGSGAIVNVNKSGATAAVQIGPGTNKDQGTIQFLDKKLATENYVDEYKEVANNALAYANAIYDYMSGNTNAWFSGTNYVTNADAASRTIFAWEDGMDPATVPCSMALWENRDGRRQCVWDQRDWTVWYWNFKAAQMKADAAATNATIYAAIEEKADRAWSKYTAAEGLENPDPNTTWINTKNIQLAAGYAWQSLAEVNGCGYWTIVGDGAVIGGSDTNATLVIKDFEGNQVLRITKGSNRLVYLDKNDYVSQGRDAQGRITFVVNSPVQPTGSFSTALDLDAFVDEDDVDCPADVEWESLGGGQWRVHFLLKNGILADQCFARFRVYSSGQTTVEYDAAQKISGGLIYNGVKIAPEITGNPSVGTVIQWKVVP